MAADARKLGRDYAAKMIARGEYEAAVDDALDWGNYFFEREFEIRIGNVTYVPRLRLLDAMGGELDG